ncbi:hypothetical protein QR680_006972 [Steinernema hermaphroditum]|uniref:Reverse transcriptase domain-containing protein n=1 Tax=Steinernema hermaphroditum TaxID=289476 RepID=A0AA39LYA3_9BILA|nr:hypothetical protein QR680_006972 [Steinernema hermaphroditum]
MSASRWNQTSPVVLHVAPGGESPETDLPDIPKGKEKVDDKEWQAWLDENLSLQGSRLSARGKTRMRKIISLHKAAFIGPDGKIGRYVGPVRHRIRLKPGARPIPQRPYRIPVPLQSEVERQIKDMLKQRIIRPSTSPFGAPIVLMKKSDGSYRFAIDYQRLNACSELPVSTLSHISDLTEAIGAKYWFSTFDCGSAFLQIPMAKDDIEKTAFITFLGLFEFLRTSDPNESKTSPDSLVRTRFPDWDSF